MLPLIGIPVLTTQVSAQVIPTENNSDTVVKTITRNSLEPAVHFEITGGQISADNISVFHRFDQLDITAEQTANFVTTPAIQTVIGSVDNANASIINGTLQVSGSDANLYLMNPAGIWIGPDAQLNLSGGFTATTATGIGFDNGTFDWTQARTDYDSELQGTPATFYFDSTTSGTVANLANLAVQPGNTISLLGNDVLNAGSLTTAGGTLTIAAVEGEQLIRISPVDSLLSLEVTPYIFPNSPDTMIEASPNAAEHRPQSLSEMLTGSALPQASTLISHADGTVELGTDIVRDQGGNVTISGQLSTAGDMGGQIDILGDRISLNNAQIDASGTNGGGAIRIGGDYQGRGSIYTASETRIDSETTISANAIAQGTGGRVIAWSDNTTEFYGSISASGGELSGNGGFAEVSGKETLIFGGRVNLSSNFGELGTLLIDPINVEITDGTIKDNSATHFSSAAFEALSQTADIRIEATNNIDIHAITNNLLTVQDGRNVTLIADSDNVDGGEFKMDEEITLRTEQGNISVFGAGITAGILDTSVSTNNSGEGGDILLQSSLGLSANLFNTTSLSDKNNAGRGGDITLIADNGDVTVSGNILAQAEADKNNSGSGGQVQINATGDITLQDINTFSSTGQNGPGNGGDVSLLADGSITTQDINTFSFAGKNNVQNGGSVTLFSAESNIQTGSIVTSNGNVSLTALESIEVDFIDASGGGDKGAETFISIDTQSSFRATSISPETNASLSTVDTSNGSISIAFSNDSQPIFIVGNTPDNISAGTIETPTTVINSESRFDSLFTGNITLANMNSEIEEPIEPEVEEPIEPEIEEPIEPEVEEPVGPEVEEPIDPEVEEPIDPEVEEPIDPEIEEPIAPEIKEPLNPSDPKIGEPVAPEIEESIEPTEKPLTESQGSEAEQLMPATNLEELLFQESAAIAQNGQTSSQFLSSEQEAKGSASNGSGLLTYQAPAYTALEITQQLEQIEATISREFREYLELEEEPHSSKPTTATTIQNTLTQVEQNTGIVPALVYAYFVEEDPAVAITTSKSNTPPSPMSSSANPNDELEILIVTPDGESIRQRQAGITRERVVALGSELRRQVTSQFSSTQQYLPPAQQLYDWIIRPIAPVLQEANVGSLGFVMDTGLRTLPIATLHNGDHYLVEDYSLGLLPSFSLTNFGEADSLNERGRFQDLQVLAMGASAFTNQAALPAVEAEVALIEQQLQGDAFLNEEFVLENLQAQLQQKNYDVLHLATHAVFESGDLNNSYIQLWDDELALNQVDSLQLSKADISLIILSACNTALGDRASEYGFAGFTVNAGADSALASLWPVNDEGTLGFMSQFYEQLGESSMLANSLRQAQISLLKGDVGITDGVVYSAENDAIATIPTLQESGQWDFSHPFYWSAFTMIGNPW
ncbi:MAG: CHAT domain-containing protein [Cyanobacteria bacterium J06634_5]